jgi:hypothetical protein
MCNRYCPKCFGQTSPHPCPRCGGAIHVCSICNRIFVETETLKDLPDKLIVHESEYHPEK